jgi:ABC-2 type transport system permease protein
MSARPGTTPAAAHPTAGFGLLVSCKIRILRNQIFHASWETPTKLFSAAAFVAVVWVGLYQLFFKVFRLIQGFTYESIIAIPLVFQFFFVALLVMLAFSNAILAYSGLFSRQESSYLLSSPVKPEHIVGLKYIEALFISSWSLLLLGLPLMMALSRVTSEPWYFYPLFIAFFLAFVPIPGALGLFTAWAAAMWLPRYVKSMLVLVAVSLFVGSLYYGWTIVRQPEIDTSLWLKNFYARLELVRGALLPSTWVSFGIDHLARHRLGAAGFYLLVTLVNALFLSWVSIRIVSRHFAVAFGRSHGLTTRVHRSVSPLRDRLLNLLFFYLPKPLRLIAGKDFRTFWRDPLQWSQLLILLGLLVLYVLNIPRVGAQFESENWNLLVSFLNVAAVSLILATFTSRFVFPLISLEGQQLWLLGLLPFSRSRLLWPKFAFAMTITLSASLGVMILSAYMLEAPWKLALTQIFLIASICIGLCGMSVGLGAALPAFDQTSPARIANGFGGTVNLIGSVVFVTVMLVGLGAVMLQIRDAGLIAFTHYTTLLRLAGVIGLGPIAAALAMVWGSTRFRRMQV